MKHDHGQPFKVVGNDIAASGRTRLRKLIRLIPNLLTLAAVVLGLTAIRLSGEGEFALAMTAILGAALLDAADGFVARRLSAESAIGAELDSLADFLNFGVAPAMLLYDRHLFSLGMAGWLIAAIYVIATGLRLARFNVQSKNVLPLPSDASSRPRKKWFCGLPSTGAAMAIMGADAAVLRLHPAEIPILIAGAAVTASALMVSKLPVPSLAALFSGSSLKR
jgi:CDP-diacylglycerol--serine O-phosphatidyltransferase